MHRRRILLLLSNTILIFFLIISVPSLASAVENPQSGSIGLQGTIPSPPPSQPAVITSPTSGQTVTNPIITVSGTCPDGTIVKVFSNGVFVGATECSNGHFSLQIELFSGTNNITAIDYDALNQAGPNSPTVTITYTPLQFSGLGPLLFITSDYAERGANPGQILSWPITLNGGTAPYALSIDWGDGQPPELLSESFAGLVNLSHTYNNAGTYTITIRATDKNGETAYMQLIGVANGPIAQSSGTTSPSSTTPKTDIIWWPSVISIPLIIITFWLGRRYELGALRKRIERQEHQ